MTNLSSRSGPDVDRTLLQRQARALGDPTRHAIYRYVEAAAGPVGVAALTDRLGLNHNAIRQHLAKLCDAGLLVEELAPPSGPGRRRLEYRALPPAAGTWGGPNPYQELALLALEVLDSGRPARQVGFDAGRRAVAAAAPAGDQLDALEAVVGRQGFDPHRVARRGSVDLVLGRCPYAAAAATHPSVVCELHRGLAEGMAAGLGGGVEIHDLVVRDPYKAGCRLQTIPSTQKRTPSDV